MRARHISRGMCVCCKTRPELPYVRNSVYECVNIACSALAKLLRACVNVCTMRARRECSGLICLLCITDITGRVKNSVYCCNRSVWRIIDDIYSLFLHCLWMQACQGAASCNYLCSASRINTHFKFQIPSGVCWTSFMF